MRCLSCEIHVIYRIVLQFNREAVIAGRHEKILSEFKDKHSAMIHWETPELSKRSMKGAVATILIDMQLPNQQKRTIKAFALGFKNIINPDDLDEGFIEIHEPTDMYELIDWEEKPVCYTKKQKNTAK